MADDLVTTVKHNFKNFWQYWTLQLLNTEKFQLENLSEKDNSTSDW